MEEGHYPPDLLSSQGVVVSKTAHFNRCGSPPPPLDDGGGGMTRGDTRTCAASNAPLPPRSCDPNESVLLVVVILNAPPLFHSLKSKWRLQTVVHDAWFTYGSDDGVVRAEA